MSYPAHIALKRFYLILGILPVLPFFNRHIPADYIPLIYLPVSAVFYLYRSVRPNWYHVWFNLLVCLLAAVAVYAHIFISDDIRYAANFSLFLWVLAGYYFLLFQVPDVPKPYKPPGRKRKPTQKKLLLSELYGLYAQILIIILTLFLLVIYFLNSSEMYYTSEIWLFSGRLSISKFDFIFYFSVLGFYAMYRLLLQYLHEIQRLTYALSLFLYFLAFIGIWIFLNYFYTLIILACLIPICLTIKNNSQYLFKSLIWVILMLIFAAFFIALTDKPTLKKYFYYNRALHSVSFNLEYDGVVPGKMEEVVYRVNNDGIAAINDEIELHLNFSDEFLQGIQISDAFKLPLPYLSGGEQLTVTQSTFVPYWLNNNPGITLRLFYNGLGYLDQFGIADKYYPVKLKPFKYYRDFNRSKLENLEQKSIIIKKSEFGRKVKTFNLRFSEPLNKLIQLPVFGNGLFNEELSEYVNLNNYIVVLAKLGVFFGGGLLILLLCLFWKILFIDTAKLNLKGRVVFMLILFVFSLGLEYNIPLSLQGIIFITVLISFLDTEVPEIEPVFYNQKI